MRRGVEDEEEKKTFDFHCECAVLWHKNVWKHVWSCVKPRYILSPVCQTIYRGCVSLISYEEAVGASHQDEMKLMRGHPSHGHYTCFISRDAFVGTKSAWHFLPLDLLIMLFLRAQSTAYPPHPNHSRGSKVLIMNSDCRINMHVFLGHQ